MAQTSDVTASQRSQGCRRFSLRFRLRTLLVLVAVFCIWLTWRVLLARHQAAAVQAVRQYGGNFYYDFNDQPRGAPPPPWRAWLADWLGDEYVYRVVGVGLSGSAVDDGGLARLAPHLARLRHLHWLDVDDVPITNEGLKSLGRVRQLKRLLLRAQGHQTPQLRISDDGLAFLGELTLLESLVISNAPVTGLGLANVQRLGHLKSLDLRSTEIGDEGLRVVASLPQLQRLQFFGTRCTDVGLEHLSQLQALVELSFQESQLTDDGVRHLLKLPNLLRLDVSQSRITDQGLIQLAGHATLQELAIYRTEVTDDGVAKVGQLAPRLVIKR